MLEWRKKKLKNLKLKQNITSEQAIECVVYKHKNKEKFKIFVKETTELKKKPINSAKIFGKLI